MDKLGPSIRTGNIGNWAQAGGDQVLLSIQVHPDVTILEAEALVARLGGTLVDSVPTVPSVTAVFHPDRALAIAQENAVQYVEVVDLPLEPQKEGSGGSAGAVVPSAAEPPAQPTESAAPATTEPSSATSECDLP